MWSLYMKKKLKNSQLNVKPRNGLVKMVTRFTLHGNDIAKIDLTPHTGVNQTVSHKWCYLV